MKCEDAMTLSRGHGVSSRGTHLFGLCIDDTLPRQEVTHDLNRTHNIPSKPTVVAQSRLKKRRCKGGGDSHRARKPRR